MFNQDENIDFHGYIDNFILWIYKKNIHKYFKTKYQWIENW